MAKETWGRWGASDERGALNLIGSEKIRAAASLVFHGEVLELSQEISSSMPVPRARTQVSHFMARDGGDYAAGQRKPGGFQFSDDTVVMPLHSGTHLDALCHCWYDNLMYNGISADTVRSSGASKLGIEGLGPVATRGVLLDLVRLTGAPLENGAAVTRDMIIRSLSENSIRLSDGDAILMRTGWQEHQGRAEYVDFSSEPGLDTQAAEYLAESGAAIVGADNFAIEQMPFPEGTVFPVHQRLIRDFGIPLLEGLVLDTLAGRNVSTFLLVMAPLPIRGATGCPVNPVAIL